MKKHNSPSKAILTGMEGRAMTARTAEQPQCRNILHQARRSLRAWRGGLRPPVRL